MRWLQEITDLLNLEINDREIVLETGVFIARHGMIYDYEVKITAKVTK